LITIPLSFTTSHVQAGADIERSEVDFSCKELEKLLPNNCKKGRGVEPVEH